MTARFERDGKELMAETLKGGTTESAAAILSVLGQKKRLEILRVLLDSEIGRGVTSLSKELAISAPTVEKHLTILKEMGLVTKWVPSEFKRERWVVRGRKRVSSIMKTLDGEVWRLVEVGQLLEELEETVRSLRYYRENPTTVREREDHRRDEERFDLLTGRLGDELSELLDEDEKKKLKYWSESRKIGLL